MKMIKKKFAIKRRKIDSTNDILKFLSKIIIGVSSFPETYCNIPRLSRSATSDRLKFEDSYHPADDREISSSPPLSRGHTIFPVAKP